MNLYSEISSLKGVGPKLKEKLNKCGVYTLLDLLLYFPRDYEFIMVIVNMKRLMKKKNNC